MLGAVPYVQASDSRYRFAEVSQLRSRSAVSVSSVGGKPSSSGRYGNQDGSIHSLVPSVHRATDRNNPQRMFGPVVVLDGNGFRDETDRFQRLLQRVPLSCGAEGRNADRDSGIERRRAETLSLAETLPRLIPNTNCCMRTNSPWTGNHYVLMTDTDGTVKVLDFGLAQMGGTPTRSGG